MSPPAQCWALFAGADVSTGTFIELSHRVVAAMAALLVAWVVVLAWKHYRRQKWILLPAIISFLLILAQAGLGGAAVLTELPRWSVMSHLAMAQIVIAAVLAVYASSGVGAITGTVDGQAGQSNLGRWATAGCRGNFRSLDGRLLRGQHSGSGRSMFDLLAAVSGRSPAFGRVVAGTHGPPYRGDRRGAADSCRDACVLEDA